MNILAKVLQISGIGAAIVIAGAARPADASTLFTYEFTYSNVNDADADVTFKTDPIPLVTGSTTISSAEISFVDLSGGYWTGATLNHVELADSATASNSTIAIFASGNHAIGYSGAGIGLADYETPGTYGNGFSTLTVASVPEPAAWALMLLGVGASGAAMRMKRRFGDVAAEF
jgi:hypothetical protein